MSNQKRPSFVFIGPLWLFGVYYNKTERELCIFPLPCCGLVIHFKRRCKFCTNSDSCQLCEALHNHPQ